MIYILQTSSAVCLCSLNSGCHDESTHNVPSHLGSHCLAMMSNATISGPILLFSTRVWMHRPLIVLFYKKLPHRLISIYTILYTYIVDDASELWRVKRKLYYMKPSSQSPFLFSSNFDKGPSHATRLMTVYISRAVVFKDCVFALATKVVNNDRS